MQNDLPGMGYETAPATALLATNCCACARPLVDANSVELGIGPICRQKYGFDHPADETARRAANAIVYQSAAEQALSPEKAAELAALGFVTLAVKLAERLCAAGVVEVTETETGYSFATPYNPEAVAAWRSVPGRRWDRDAKVNTCPKSSKGAAWRLLKTYYAGAILKTPKGTAVIVAKENPQ